MHRPDADLPCSCWTGSSSSPLFAVLSELHSVTDNRRTFHKKQSHKSDVITINDKGLVMLIVVNLETTQGQEI